MAVSVLLHQQQCWSCKHMDTVMVDRTLLRWWTWHNWCNSLCSLTGRELLAFQTSATVTARVYMGNAVTVQLTTRLQQSH
jgi:hypothetical protein